jgi:hypothetical protein
MQYTLEDFLVKLHMGQWFGWSDSKNKTYANLVIHSDDTTPTEQECLDGVTALQSEYDNNLFQRQRAQEYPPIADQLDDIFHNGIDGWKASIQVVKDKFPKT